MPQEMGNCTQLTYIFVSGNKLIGSLPNSLSNLNNLKRLDISYCNYFSGALQFSREYPVWYRIPKFDFENLQALMFHSTISLDQFQTLKGRFSVDSFLGNPGLCGYPLPNNCPPSK
ncbi:hypothetical protein MKX03_023652 [Papaver bracteatum]|nr:hypothetical protein MKX03_023652 [Papaver bracteatum]